ncbi:MAG: zinc ribbon domain-containing protein, partial [Oscillospiraceae bacterium]|nr:zinc ribbon domain-containing protein [Oscillospiraceae bacterium]
MFCKHCGAKLPDGVSFCTNCGQDVRPASPAGSASAAGAAASEVRPAFRGSAAAFAAAANPSPSETCTAYKGNPTAAAPSASAGCAAYGDKPGAGAAAFVTPASDETPRLSVPPEIPGHEPHDAGASVSWARSAGADRTSGVGATPAYGAGSGGFGATPAYGAGTTGAYGTDTAVETEAPKKNRTLAIVLSICGGLLLIGVGVLLFFLL